VRARSANHRVPHFSRSLREVGPFRWLCAEVEVIRPRGLYGARPDSPSTIQDTKRYLHDFDRLQKTATSGQEPFDQMTELYPHWVANQSWLMFGFPEP
jgi:hypothetical protein